MDDEEVVFIAMGKSVMTAEQVKRPLQDVGVRVSLLRIRRLFPIIYKCFTANVNLQWGWQNRKPGCSSGRNVKVMGRWKYEGKGDKNDPKRLLSQLTWWNYGTYMVKCIDSWLIVCSESVTCIKLSSSRTTILNIRTQKLFFLFFFTCLYSCTILYWWAS